MSEFQEQKELIKWFRSAYPKYGKTIRLSMNGINLGGGVKAARIINQMKSQGMTKHESDLFFAVPNNDYFGLFLEMKADGEKPGKDQIEYLEDMSSLGYLATWADSADGAMKIIKEYMRGL